LYCHRSQNLYPCLGVWLKNGTGPLANGVTYSSMDRGFGLTAIDLNGDGAKDLAFASESTHTAGVMLNQGNGTFGPRQDYVVGLTPDWIAAGDWNNDGRMDLAVENYHSPSVTILRNTCLP